MKRSSLAYAAWFLVAAALHAVIFAASGRALFTSAEYAVAGTLPMDLELVESAPPAPTPVSVESLPTAPTSQPKQPAPSPLPIQTAPAPMLAPAPTAAPEIKQEPVPPSPQTKPEVKSQAESKAPSTESPSKSTVSSTKSHPDVLPSYRYNPAPKYPAESRVNHEQGLVVLRVSVNSEGHVAALRLGQSSGFTRLDNAALAAVKDWKFRPAHLAGIPVATEIEVPVRFRLER